MRNSSLLCIASISLALLGCSVGQNTELAEAQIPIFRKAVESEQFDSIYEQSSEDLKSSASKSDLVEFLSGVREKLGPVTSSTQKTWNVNYRLSTTYVTLVYETKFANGAAAEVFVYRIEGKQVQLAGYHSTTFM